MKCAPETTTVANSSTPVHHTSSSAPQSVARLAVHAHVPSCDSAHPDVDVMHTSCFQSLLHRLSQRLRVPIARDHHLHCPRPRPRPTKVQHQPLSLLEDQTSRTSSGAMAAAQLCVAAKLQREEVPVQPQSAATYPFTVLTFNVLADGLAQDGDFVHVSLTSLRCSTGLLAAGQTRTCAMSMCCRPPPRSCSGSTGCH